MATPSEHERLDLYANKKKSGSTHSNNFDLDLLVLDFSSLPQVQQETKWMLVRESDMSEFRHAKQC